MPGMYDQLMQTFTPDTANQNFGSPQDDLAAWQRAVEELARQRGRGGQAPPPGLSRPPVFEGMSDFRGVAPPDSRPPIFEGGVPDYRGVAPPDSRPPIFEDMPPGLSGVAPPSSRGLSPQEMEMMLRGFSGVPAPPDPARTIQMLPPALQKMITGLLSGQSKPSPLEVPGEQAAQGYSSPASPPVKPPSISTE